MFDTTAQVFTEYQYELKLKKAAEVFEKYSIDCPACGIQVVLPPQDYLCHECRQKASILG